ncbi:MAG: hypothetical protein AAFV80_10245, partial [Bacteroidota bacterium]
MSNLDRLLKAYREDSRISKINAAQEPDQANRILLSGMIGSQISFALAASFLERPRQIIAIANDKESAAYLH